jgi:DinB superfamily
MTVGVAEAMPPVQYAFRPDPGSMSFGELISHVVQTNYSFCAGLKDTAPPPKQAIAEKDALVKLWRIPSIIAPPQSPLPRASKWNGCTLRPTAVSMDANSCSRSMFMSPITAGSRKCICVLKR